MHRERRGYIRVHKSNLQQDNLSYTELIELSLENAEQLKEVKLRQDIILARLNDQYLREHEQPQQAPKTTYKPLTYSEKEELDFNPLAYLEHKGLLTFSEYDSDNNFIQTVIDNYVRLGLSEYKVCVHNITVRVQDLTKAPINNKRAYIKSSLIKHKAKK